MRVLVISDIHANVHALECLPPADLVICAGDVVTFGADPAACVDWLRDRRAICVRGEEDDAVGNGTFHQPVPELEFAAKESRAWTSRVLDAPRRAWLGDLPPEAEVEAGGTRIGVVHAYPGDYNRYLRPTGEELERITRAFPRARLVVAGHTHRPGIWRHGDSLLVNPGSVGLPSLPGTSAYALIENGHVTLGRVAFDVNAAIGAVCRTRMSDRTIAACADELRSGARRPYSRLIPLRHAVAV